MNNIIKKVYAFLYKDFSFLVYLLLSVLTIVKIDSAKIRFLPIMLFLISYSLIHFRLLPSLLREIQKNTKYKLLFLYVLLAASSFLSYFRLEALVRWVMMFLNLFFLASLFKDPFDKITQQLKYFTMIILPTCFLPILSNEAGNIGKLSSVYSTHNVLGVVLSGVLYFSHFCFKKNTKWMISALLALPIYFTLSRSTVLFYLIFMILAVLKDLFSNKSYRVVAAVFLLVNILTYSFFLDYNNQHSFMRFVGRFHSFENEGKTLTMRGREILVMAALKKSMEKPLGIGLGMSAGPSAQHFSKLTPHNGLVKMLLENGVLSLIALLVFLALFVTRLEGVHLIMFAAFFSKNLFESVTVLGLTFGSVLILLPFLMRTHKKVSGIN